LEIPATSVPSVSLFEIQVSANPAEGKPHEHIQEHAKVTCIENTQLVKVATPHSTVGYSSMSTSTVAPYVLEMKPKDFDPPWCLLAMARDGEPIRYHGCILVIGESRHFVARQSAAGIDLLHDDYRLSYALMWRSRVTSSKQPTLRKDPLSVTRVLCAKAEKRDKSGIELYICYLLLFIYKPVLLAAARPQG